MVPLLRVLEQQLLPALPKAGDEIAGEFLRVKVQVFSTRLEPDGRLWAISCLLSEAEPEHSDEVVLEVAVSQLSSSPTLEALVIWGYPGDIEREIANMPLDLNDEALIKMQDILPQLVEVLKNAVKRGHPDVPPSNQR